MKAGASSEWQVFFRRVHDLQKMTFHIAACVEPECCRGLLDRREEIADKNKLGVPGQALARGDAGSFRIGVDFLLKGRGEPVERTATGRRCPVEARAVQRIHPPVAAAPLLPATAR